VQDESQATYEGWFDEAEARIDWSRHVDQVYDLIRAANPAPGAWTMLGEQRVALFDCRKHTARRHAQVKGKPGEVSEITGTSIFINANGGRIEVLRVRPAGGKKVDAGEFARAISLAPSSS
jgi:methionyl-tRNA formyltransferase